MIWVTRSWNEYSPDSSCHMGEPLVRRRRPGGKRARFLSSSSSEEENVVVRQKKKTGILDSKDDLAPECIATFKRSGDRCRWEYRQALLDSLVETHAPPVWSAFRSQDNVEWNKPVVLFTAWKLGFYKPVGLDFELLNLLSTDSEDYACLVGEMITSCDFKDHGGMREALNRKKQSLATCFFKETHGDEPWTKVHMNFYNWRYQPGKYRTTPNSNANILKTLQPDCPLLEDFLVFDICHTLGCTAENAAEFDAKANEDKITAIERSLVRSLFKVPATFKGQQIKAFGKSWQGSGAIFELLNAAKIPVNDNRHSSKYDLLKSSSPDQFLQGVEGFFEENDFDLSKIQGKASRAVGTDTKIPEIEGLKVHEGPHSMSRLLLCYLYYRHKQSEGTETGFEKIPYAVYPFFRECLQLISDTKKHEAIYKALLTVVIGQTEKDKTIGNALKRMGVPNPDGGDMWGKIIIGALRGSLSAVQWKNGTQTATYNSFS